MFSPDTCMSFVVDKLCLRRCTLLAARVGSARPYYNVRYPSDSIGKQHAVRCPNPVFQHPWRHADQSASMAARKRSWIRCLDSRQPTRIQRGGVTIHPGYLCKCGFSRSRFLRRKALPDSIDIALSSWSQVEIAPWVPGIKLSWATLSCMPPQNSQEETEEDTQVTDRQQHNTFRRLVLSCALIPGTSLNLSQSQTLWNLPELSENTRKPERKPTIDPCQNTSHTFYIEYIDTGYIAIITHYGTIFYTFAG